MHSLPPLAPMRELQGHHLHAVCTAKAPQPELPPPLWFALMTSSPATAAPSPLQPATQRLEHRHRLPAAARKSRAEQPSECDRRARSPCRSSGAVAGSRQSSYRKTYVRSQSRKHDSGIALTGFSAIAIAPLVKKHAQRWKSLWSTCNNDDEKQQHSTNIKPQGNTRKRRNINHRSNTKTNRNNTLWQAYNKKRYISMNIAWET